MGKDDDERAWVKRVLGLDLGNLAAETRSPSDGMITWQRAVDSALGELRAVIDAVRSTGEPGSAEVEIVLRSIAANLTRAPETPNAIDELRRFLADNDVITAAEEVPPEFGHLQLRAPLLQALDALAA